MTVDKLHQGQPPQQRINAAGRGQPLPHLQAALSRASASGHEERQRHQHVAATAAVPMRLQIDILAAAATIQPPSVALALPSVAVASDLTFGRLRQDGALADGKGGLRADARQPCGAFQRLMSPP